MKQFFLGLLRQSAIKLLVWAATPMLLVAGYLFREQLSYACSFMSEAPAIVWAAVLLSPTLIILAMISWLARYVLSPDSSRIDPRYRWWLDSLFARRVLIDTGSLFGYGRKMGVYGLINLHFTVKVRRGTALQLKACYMESLRTGLREDFLFSGPGPSMHLDDLRQLRPGVLVEIHSRQLDMTMEQFIDRWGGFKIVLAYDNSVFEREYPLPALLKHLSKLWLRHHSQIA